MAVLNFYDCHTPEKRINPSQANTNKVHETNNTEMQDLSVDGFLWVIHFCTEVEAPGQGSGLSFVI